MQIDSRSNGGWNSALLERLEDRRLMAVDITGAFDGTLNMRAISIGNGASFVASGNGFVISTNFSNDANSSLFSSNSSLFGGGMGLFGAGFNSSFASPSFVAALPSAGFGGDAFIFNGAASPATSSIGSGIFSNIFIAPAAKFDVPMTLNITRQFPKGHFNGTADFGSFGQFDVKGSISGRKFSMRFIGAGGDAMSGTIRQNGDVLVGKLVSHSSGATLRGDIRMVRS